MSSPKPRSPAKFATIDAGPLPMPPLPPEAPPALSVRLCTVCGPEVALGPGKAELLDAVARTGSITKAAKSLGVSYMHAWSLIQVMNRRFREPLVHMARGGQKGGGAGLTDEGRAVLALYREMAAETVRAAAPLWERLRVRLVNGEAGANPKNSVALSSSKEDDDLMEQSIRNELPGTVKEIVSEAVLSEVIVETAIGEVASVITTRSVHDMGLKVGDEVRALVKATNVSLKKVRS